MVQEAPGARARRVGIGPARRESSETLEPARLRLELKLSTLGLRPRDIPLVTVEASDRDRDPADKGDVIGFAKKTRSARDRKVLDSEALLDHDPRAGALDRCIAHSGVGLQIGRAHVSTPVTHAHRL